MPGDLNIDQGPLPYTRRPSIRAVVRRRCKRVRCALPATRMKRGVTAARRSPDQGGALARPSSVAAGVLHLSRKSAVSARRRPNRQASGHNYLHCRDRVVAEPVATYECYMGCYQVTGANPPYPENPSLDQHEYRKAWPFFICDDAATGIGNPGVGSADANQAWRKACPRRQRLEMRSC